MFSGFLQIILVENCLVEILQFLSDDNDDKWLVSVIKIQGGLMYVLFSKLVSVIIAKKEIFEV